jgi:hypothetical protein
MNQGNPPSLADLMTQLSTVKKKVFISYHHADQAAVNSFRHTYANTLDVFGDKSLNIPFNSMNTEYVYRMIREKHITGSSVTIVVCGYETWKRKYVDWEINATLSKNHALLGIIIPGTPLTLYDDGTYKMRIPQRLFSNHESGYAHVIDWPNNSAELSNAINHAANLSKQNANFKSNSAPLMSRNH